MIGEVKVHLRVGTIDNFLDKLYKLTSIPEKDLSEYIGVGEKIILVVYSVEYPTDEVSKYLLEHLNGVIWVIVRGKELTKPGIIPRENLKEILGKLKKVVEEIKKKASPYKQHQS